MDFQTRYAKLNDNQRRAVDTIFGPLLVIAGPGTGKTELLSMRAANILQKTDTLPSNILCLTFTDSGAVNMRERLRQIIGEDAYKIAIHTFHGFGTEIINQNREYFFRGAEMKPTDDLTQHQIMQRLFDELDWQHPLASKNFDEYVYLGDTLKVISEFKQSGLAPDELRLIISDNQRTIDTLNPHITKIFSSKISKSTIEEFAPLAQVAASINQVKLPESVTSYHQVVALSLAHAAQEAIDSNSTKPITAWKNSWCEKNTQGEMVLKDTRATDKLLASVELYEKYQQTLAQQQLFDYDDMILSVLRACEANSDLRSNLQEQYQFIMVDEFQDTNLAQLRLLFDITGEGSEPNVMAVGDDDQAIFSFQGADVGNIHKFREHYGEPEIIVLTDNYRSTATILGHAREVITQGTDRLENTIGGLSKELTAHTDSTDTVVNIQQHSSQMEERANVARQIAKMIQSGTPPEHIAVLARRHNELIELLPYLYSHGIMVNYERYDDVLEQDIVKLLELISRTVLAIHRGDHGRANALMPELLAHPALGFSSRDIWNISLNAWRNRTLWLEAMTADPVFQEFADWIITRASEVTHRQLESQLDEFIAKIHDYFFSAEKLDSQPDTYLSALEAFRTIRDRLREHYQSTDPTLDQFVEFIELHHSTKTRMTTVRPHADNQSGAVNLMTAHKAKGLEFPHVYIIGAVDSAWGEKVRSRSRLIRYPANLQLQPAGASYDERLRLFFVAMTRAKTTLNISYSDIDSSGKENLVASFLSRYTPNVAPKAPDIASLTSVSQIDWSARLTSPITTDLKSILASTLESYKLSVTHLNNFLDVSRGGPQGFLLTNLLRFPQIKSPATSYGTAIHSTLQHAHNSVRIDGALPPMDDLKSYFTNVLADQHLDQPDFEVYSQKGTAALEAFISSKSGNFSRSQMTELNFAGQGVVVGEAKLTGALDLVDIDKQQKTIFVTDYKTGKPARDWKGTTDYEKIKLHKYRQQLMFYQLLTQNSRDYSGFTFTGGRLQFVEPENRTGEILCLEDTFSDEGLRQFEQLVQAVWTKITDLDLPDISIYEPTYSGMVQFEQDLLENSLT
ncbi:hypothetical protein B7Y94_01495 [Candidatus Saccharibacteria bacterium 32-49-12]|nr:MAG: hypothetical protein B7Y94_01495 [Candidatus Saccharibacteria bacterium 32-49-12]